MNNPNINKQKLINSIVNASKGKISGQSASRAANGDISELVAGLDEESRRKLNEALSNQHTAKQILSSPAAKKLLEGLMNGGNNNG